MDITTAAIMAIGGVRHITITEKEKKYTEGLLIK
jgi:hypothetical protein